MREKKGVISMSQGDVTSTSASSESAARKNGHLHALKSCVAHDRGFGMLCIVLGVVLGTSGLGTSLIQTTLMAGLSMALGMYLLMKTSDVLINHSAAMGRKLGISTMTLGIALGMLTSLPELLVSVGAILQKICGAGYRQRCRVKHRQYSFDSRRHGGAARHPQSGR
jgi:hypothetical protein